MSDPTPHNRRSPMEHEHNAPTPADELVERMAYLFCENKATNEMFPREDDYDLARAVVALVLDEAAKPLIKLHEAEKALRNACVNGDPHIPERIASLATARDALLSVRALIPEAKP